MVPSLVVAVRIGLCDKFQHYEKLTNCDKVNDCESNSLDEGASNHGNMTTTTTVPGEHNNSRESRKARKEKEKELMNQVMLNGRHGLELSVAKTEVSRQDFSKVRIWSKWMTARQTVSKE